MTLATKELSSGPRPALGDDIGLPVGDVLVQRHQRITDDSLFGEVIDRLLVLHELQKSGALTYDEFRTLKVRLLDL